MRQNQGDVRKKENYESKLRNKWTRKAFSTVGQNSNKDKYCCNNQYITQVIAMVSDVVTLYLITD